MPQETRATNIELARRVNLVGTLLLSGATRHDVLQMYQKQWNVKERQIDEYIAKYRKLIEKEMEVDRTQNLAKALRQRQMLYRNLVVKKNWIGALEVLKDVAKLQRLYDETLRVEAKVLVGKFDFSGRSRTELEEQLIGLERFIAERSGDSKRINQD